MGVAYASHTTTISGQYVYATISWDEGSEVTVEITGAFGTGSWRIRGRASEGDNTTYVEGDMTTQTKTFTQTETTKNYILQVTEPMNNYTFENGSNSLFTVNFDDDDSGGSDSGGGSDGPASTLFLSIAEGEGTNLSVVRTWSKYGDYGGDVAMIDGNIVFYDGDRFSITCEAEEGWDLTYFTFEGKQVGFYLTNFTSSSTEGIYKLASESNAKIASYANPKQNALSISESEGMTLTVDRLSSKNLSAKTGVITASDPIYYADKLKITCTPNKGYETPTLNVNGTSFSSGNTYTVSGNTNIVAATEVISNTLILNPDTGTTIVVNRTSSPVKGASITSLSDGDLVYHSDVLQIIFNSSAEYKIIQQLVNQEFFTSGNTYTVTDVDVEITTITELSGVVHIYSGAEFENFVIYIFNGSSWNQYIPYVFDGAKWNICS